jgi:deoxyribodipyrimidine photo-lyase
MSVNQPQESRIQQLNAKPIRAGAYVLYWMQSSQRAEDNYALEHAIHYANDLDKPLLVAFGLTDDYPEANLRHYLFMLEGLAEVETSLRRRQIKLVVQRGSPDAVALKLAQDACLLVTDRGYLRLHKHWRATVAREAPCRVVQVEDNVVVPIEQVADKAEHAARTIRPKINRQRDQYLVELRTTPVNLSSLGLAISGVDISDPVQAAKRLKLDTSVAPVSRLFRGGTAAAKHTLATFIDKRFSAYQKHRNQPQTDDTSYMAMYLHFGQISPIYAALKVRDCGAAQENIDSYLEELIVRRELAVNFCYYTDDYDRYSCIPDWAKRTLAQHKDDPRDPYYTREQLEQAKTHDPYWNAAMNEMRYTGYMHNYMRMYWGKKVIEWSSSPEYAYETLLYLNNRYFLDGRDPNSYVGVAWCFGVHDRAWTERPVLGKLRYMNASGLKRKADPEAYVEKVNERITKVS